MRYLVPIGGDHGYGMLISPGTYGIPTSVANGYDWAADNQAFTKGFNPDIFFPWLDRFRDYKSTCLFVTIPDCIGNATVTINLFTKWRSMFNEWKVAFVAQDEQEDLEFPPAELWDTLFIGGSTKWKLGSGAVECILRAQELNKHIHIGRVNYWRRFQYFASLPGSERFTCDGTRTRYEKTKCLSDWQKYMDSPKQYNLFIPDGDHLG